MLLLVSQAVLFAGKAAAGRLRAAVVATEERFGVSLVVFAKIATSTEGRPRSTATVGASPSPVSVAGSPSCHL